MSEFYDLLHGTTRIRELPPVPDGDKFDVENEAKNSLCKFHLDKVRAREVHEVLEMAATETKIKQFKNIEKNRFAFECNLGPPQGFYFDKMQKYAERLPTVGLIPEWESTIRNLVAEILREKYVELFEIHMNETKEHYHSTMHELGIQSVISKGCGCDWPEIVDPPYKLPGRTENYQKFLINRCSIMRKYFLPHKLIKNIFSRPHSVMPKFICDFRRYRPLGFLDLTRFLELVDVDMKKGALAIEKTYYTEIVRLVSQPRYIHDIPNSIVSIFLRCASKLLSYQIIKRMMKSIQHFLDVLSDDAKSPLLVIELQCKDSSLYTVPSINEIHIAFHNLLDNIASIAQKLPPLESWVDIKTPNEFIPIVTPEWYLEMSHERLTKIFHEKYQPLKYYLNGLHEQFGVVYDVKTHDDVVDYVAEEHTFEDCLERLEDFNQFIRDINGMTGNEYFTVGKLHQEEGKIGLKFYTENVRELIIQQLVKRHRNFNLEICENFEELKERCLNIPTNTRELLALGEYMLYATTQLMDTLHAKVELSLYMLTSLLEMTFLDKDHIELNNETVNWLKRIKPILEQNSSMYEQMKFDLEEQLQSKVEDLEARVDGMFPRLVILNDMDDATRIREYIEDMRKIIREMDRMEEDGEWINQEERLFKFPISPYPKLNELKEIIIPFYELIYRAYQWQRDCGVWLDGPFEYLDANVIENKTTDYLTDFTKTGKMYKAKIKMHTAMGYPYSFEGSVDDPDPFLHPAPMKLCFQLLENVKWFKPYVALASCVCNPALRQRHWDEMSKIAGFDLTPNAGTTLRKIIDMDLMDDLVNYELISIGGTRELALQKLLSKMIHDWDDMIFTTMPFKDSGVAILTQLDDIEALLEEHIVKIQAMRGSAFVKPIENDVKVFYDLLLRIQRTIEEWTKVQVQWMYLLPIFSSKDIVSQLPEEGIMFQDVDGTFRRSMLGVSREPHVRETAGSVRKLMFIATLAMIYRDNDILLKLKLGLYEVMKDANELLEKVNEGVTNYLEKKRLFFPRFFFLSNEDMLEILSETKDPLRVQPHLKKCFEGIAKLGFNEELEIYSMFSDDKEEVKIEELISTSEARGCVERWLVQVEEQMVKSIRHEILMSYLDYDTNKRVDWVIIWPGMVVLCVSQIYWSMEVQNCLMTHMISTIETLYKKLQSQILDMVNLVKGQLSKQSRTTLTALITIDVHAHDVVKLLIDKQIVNETDFQWLAQLRYYWEDDVFVRIINATVPYAYEYLGNCPRLVITPLTDRCYRTLIGAYSLHLNGAPEGPAGTGKTETTKDLGRAIAVQCVVFNCSDGLDYKNMGKFFKGLASCGAWACFDEFNRIELEVLSVVAQQIFCIIQAVRAHLQKFIFEGTEIRLNPAVYVCITMNPGYAGRSELPDNLKVLFRTVAMMVPDYAMIGEIFLYSSGFSTARILSIKIVTTYKLCSEQLSSQSHYDYGMRAVKTVLTAAQNIKLKYPNEDEMILLLRSIIDVNLPKFLAHDVPLFQGIIADLFPGVILPSPSYDILLKAVHKVAEKNNLQTVDGFMLKIIQTFEMMIVRHGFMLVGDPFGGKTTVLHTLAEALSLMKDWEVDYGAKTFYTTINPKAITMGQLYGQFDPVSSEWTDGVAAVAFRKYCAEDTPDRKWLIFDGPVDAVWIENLNTVLDDNKKLCLTSGEVMQMTGVMSMIFEVMDLLQASPATVSRCGMIYIEPHVLGWRPFVDSWFNKVKSFVWSKGNRGLLADLFDWLMEICLEFIRKNCHMTINAGQINQVVSTLNLFEIFMKDAVDDNTQDYELYLEAWIQASMLLSMIWGVGGTLDQDSIKSFNEFYVSLWRNEMKDHPVPENLVEIMISLPGEGTIHDNYYTFKSKGAWRYFGEIAKMEKLIETESIGLMIVPTIETVKYQNLFLRHIRHQKRFLLYGETGTGKSFYIQDIMMNKLEEETYLPNLITFTTRTTAGLTQELVISKLFKRRKGHYGPMGGTTCVVFIDDVNMPAKEIYGAQPAVELLRQFFDHQHWYDLKEPEKIHIFDTMFVCAMAPPGGSRQEVYQRFLRHFNLYTIHSFSEESISKIFGNIGLVGLKRNGFPTEVISSVNILVDATLVVFRNATRALRPTPAKSHYLFNLRDFSRVITGCTMIKKESVESKTTFTKLWVHEILRVFGDRLIDNDDRKWLFEQLKETVKNTIREPFDFVFDHLPKFDGQLTELSMKNLIFGNFMDMDANPDEKIYQEVLSIDEFQNVAILCLEEYNNTHKNKMDIVLFRYALEHLARISRILAIPGGSLLMVGVGGSGRQSLTRLAAGMAGCGLFQPEIGSAYGINEWREDVKRILKNSGGIGKNLAFLFNEGQIKEEAFLSDIDSLLNSGEVPNLFTVEERQEIIEMCRLAAQGGNRNLDISVLAVIAFFVNRCKEKLHIMLCFSPIGESFRIRLRLYPSLVSCCTIDWFDIWPEDALEQVAIRCTTDINVTDEIKINSVVACKYFHVCAKEISKHFYQSRGRKTYITSAAFLDLIRTFADLMREKQEELTLARDRYLGGLDKLEFAAQQVAKMKSTLVALRPQLELSAKVTTQTMKEIENENLSVESATIMVKREEDAANIQAEISGKLKQECEADLAEALPVLEEAIAALNTLKPSDISLVKSMKNPPEGVKLVMAAICVMLNIQPDRLNDPATGRKILDYWPPSKRILGDMKFLDYLRDYDKDNIPIATMQIIKKTYIENKNFEPKIVAKASQAAEGLCKWVRAMVLYDKVAKEVAPKKAKLAIAEKQYEDTMAFLNEKRRMLAELNAKLATLNHKLQVTLAKKIDLETQVTSCRNKLIRAEKLISGLGGEKDRWFISAQNLQMSYDTLPGDILISCGMIAYLGPFTTSYRIQNIEKWWIYVRNLKIPCSEKFSFVTVLGSEIKINSWNIFGLPRDTSSTENAIIMDNSKRWSLFIDPQSQANKWIRNMEKLSELEVVKLTDAKYMHILEQCIEYGKPVLIENIAEELDASLDPILMKKIYTISGTSYITLGETTIEYGSRFRLYMTTKLRNPHYLPEIFNKVTLINFALTIEGLEDQLLGIVVAKERPDLQIKREYLIVQGAANKKALQQVEDNILRTLSISGATILEDEEAIEILDSSKILSIDILKKQEASKDTEAKIEIFRQSYRPIAKHSSALYYTVTDLPNIDPMYQYSLTWFINLYVVSIETANKSKILERRLMFLRDTFTFNLYQNVCRSLFEKDKVLYSFILYTTILLANDEIEKEELLFFLSGGHALGNPVKNPAPDWLQDRSWDEICRVGLASFANFMESFRENLSAWKNYYDLMNPQNSKIPEPWESKLTAFQKLIVMRMIRPDKITAKVIQFVEAGMGKKFVKPPPFDLTKSYADSNYLIPLIFILSSGSDPMGALSKFAENMDYASRFRSISLGQGQGPIAKKLIEEGQNEGTWVCLQNCHLAVSWMPELEKICENFDVTNTSVNFRLWLTSYPSEKFPIAVLQHGVKMTNEPPTGLQQNLMRSYMSEPVKDPEFFDGCPGKEKAFTKLLYGLCFFHAVVQERRNYGAQGWNIRYGFNESDFLISVQQLQIFINDYESVQFEAITYLTGECNYGGRVTDDRDRRCLNTILEDFYNPNVINDPNYAFADVGPEYTLPKKCDYRDYVKQIEGIPTTPPPEVFGLHMNAGITRDLDVSKIFFDSMLKVHGTVTTGDTSKQDELLLTMKKDIYDRMPELFDLEEAQKVYPVVYAESMNTVLIQEMERYNTLLSVIRSSMVMLENAVKGMIVMTPELELLASSMLNAKIPSTWAKASAYPSLKPLPSFINDFLERLKFLQNWLDNGKPATFWIAGFSFVHAFLTGATQNYARKYKISIDKIDFDFEIMNIYESSTAPTDGVYVYGMYLAGARWNLKDRKLAESVPKVLWDLMPIVWLKPSVVTNIKIGGRYECPLYITSARFGTLKTTGHSTNYVLSLLIDTDKPVSHWIKRGLALLCQLDD